MITPAAVPHRRTRPETAIPAAITTTPMTTMMITTLPAEIMILPEMIQIPQEVIPEPAIPEILPETAPALMIPAQTPAPMIPAAPEMTLAETAESTKNKRTEKKMCLAHLFFCPDRRFRLQNCLLFLNNHSGRSIDSRIISKRRENNRGRLTWGKRIFLIILCYTVNQRLSCFGDTAAYYNHARIRDTGDGCDRSSQIISKFLHHSHGQRIFFL